MIGIMAGEKNKGKGKGKGQKGILFNSWEYDRDIEKAEALMKNLITMQRPVVYRGNVMCWLVHDVLGVRAEQMTLKNLRAELDKANYYQVRRLAPILVNGKPVIDPDDLGSQKKARMAVKSGI